MPTTNERSNASIEDELARESRKQAAVEKKPRKAWVEGGDDWQYDDNGFLIHPGDPSDYGDN